MLLKTLLLTPALLGTAFIPALIRIAFASAPLHPPLTVKVRPGRLAIHPFRMRYLVLRNGWHLGNAIFTLMPGENSWEFHSTAKASGLAALFIGATFSETSRFRVNNGRLQPLAYAYTDSGNKSHDERIVFDWRRGEALDFKGAKRKIFNIEPGVLGRATAQLDLSRRLLAGKRPGGSYRIVNGGKLGTYRLTRKKNTAIATPAGNFKTVVLERKDAQSRRTTTFWLAGKLQYLPVKIRQSAPGKATVTFVLAKYRRLPAPGKR